MKFERKKMVDWFNIKQLSATAVKAMISSIIGNYADKREMQAALGQGELEYDLSRITPTDPTIPFKIRDEIWIDYVADVGDGFNSTYTVAHSLAQAELKIDGRNLKRGDLLIMGGDQVYPAPIKQEYVNRMTGPYEAAFPKTGDHCEAMPHMFSIPGNHDWYDGLAQFIKLFCQKRTIGNWQTQQKRSYFAVKLLDNCWLWGIDVQLNADIDIPQIQYFEEVITKMKSGDDGQPGDNIILCTAEPAWVYNSLQEENQALSRLDFFRDRYILKKKFNLVATISGDLHHYSHYIVNDENIKIGNHLITAGGGGAFMHPTHNLPDEITTSNEKKAKLNASYPSKAKSGKLVFRNLFFPLLNWGNLSFASCLFGGVYLLTAWLLQSVTESTEEISYLEELSTLGMNLKNIPVVFKMTVDILFYAPSVVIINLLFGGGLYLFTDVNSRKGKFKVQRLIGFMHAFVQICGMYTSLWIFSRLNLSEQYLHLNIASIHQILLMMIEMTIAGVLIGGLLFGIYLLICNRFLSMHDNEAFSSLKWQHHKNFLRIHATPDVITIYPIGIDRVVEDWENVGTTEKPRFSGSQIKYRLINDQPITINLKE